MGGSGEADRTPDAGTDAARQAAEQGRGAHPCAAGGADGKPGTRALNFPRTRCQGGCFLFNIFCACFSSCPPSHSFPTPTRQAEKQEAVTGVERGSQGRGPHHPPARSAAQGLTAELFQTWSRACHLKAENPPLASFLYRRNSNICTLFYTILQACCHVPASTAAGFPLLNSMTHLFFFFSPIANAAKICSSEIIWILFSKYQFSLNNF